MANNIRRKDLSAMLGKDKVSVKASGQL